MTPRFLPPEEITTTVCVSPEKSSSLHLGAAESSTNQDRSRSSESRRRLARKKFEDRDCFESGYKPVGTGWI